MHEGRATENFPFWTQIANRTDAAAGAGCARNAFCSWRRFRGTILWPSGLYRGYPGWNVPELLKSTPPQPSFLSTYLTAFFSVSLLFKQSGGGSTQAYCAWSRIGFYRGTKITEARRVLCLLGRCRTQRKITNFCSFIPLKYLNQT